MVGVFQPARFSGADATISGPPKGYATNSTAWDQPYADPTWSGLCTGHLGSAGDPGSAAGMAMDVAAGEAATPALCRSLVTTPGELPIWLAPRGIRQRDRNFGLRGQRVMHGAVGGNGQQRVQAVGRHAVGDDES